MSKHFVVERQASYMLLLGVSIVLLQATLAQSYLLALSEQPANFIDIDRLFGKWNISLVTATTTEENTNQNNNNNNITNNHTVETLRQKYLDDLNSIRNNSTLFIYENTFGDKRHTDLSQSTMDVVTIVWYVATFLALAAFFLLMACSDRRCNENRTQRNAETQANEAAVVPPLTPTPSYSEFAPPTYEAVMKMKEDARNSGIYVVSVPLDNSGSVNAFKTDNNNTINGNDELINVVIDGGALPVVDFYTIDEMQKNES